MAPVSSSKSPLPPLPHPSIYLDTPSDKTFHPGDRVTGHFTLIPSALLFPRAIIVSLFGHSFIWHRVDCGQNPANYQHYRDDAPLFEISQDVLQSKAAESWTKPGEKPMLLPGRTYKFQFEFWVPAETSNVRTGRYKNDTDARFVVGPHDLPPTFLYTNKYDEGDGTDANFAKVEYGVKVLVMRQNDLVAQGIEELAVTAPIVFQPSIPNLQQELPGAVSVRSHTKAFNLQSSVLAGKPRTQIGFRQGLRDRFSSATPALKFDATIELPDTLLSGSEFRLRTAFTVVSKTDSVAHIPAIKFSIMKLDLLDFTSVRVPRDWDASFEFHGHFHTDKFGPVPPPPGFFTRDSERDENAERKTHLNCLPESATVELVEVPSYENKAVMEQAKSCEAWFTSRLPTLIPPSFTSFAISRSYRVKFNMRVEVGGKMFEYGAESQVKELGSAPV